MGNLITTTEAGRSAEIEAEAWLMARSSSDGFVVIARNWRWRGGEIDLVAEEVSPRGHLELVFIEVRTRNSESRIRAIDTVGYGKQLKLQRTASLFIDGYRRRGGRATSLRWDFLTREPNGQGEIGWTLWRDALR